MPTYEYRCESCEHQFERSQSISAAPLKRCPQCGGKIHRIISGGGGFLFKGGAPTATSATQSTEDSSSCCGLSNPCADPKRCCGR